jgi:asparagine synthase (glutamine-hydrolysing)
VCGIAGTFHFERRPNKKALTAMLEVLGHRGPDGRAIQSLADGHLGANRLAIVDVAGGKNPQAEETGRFWVALNGEVYNHGPLRKELEARGASFQTRTDTEVVARLFLAQPAKALDRLQGMFALAVYDTEKRSLLLARDRLGQKPLYWTQLDDGTLLFASELAGLLVHPEVKRAVNQDALAQLLLSEYIAAPSTLYQGIHKLEPGCLLEASAAGIRSRRWWNPPIPGLQDDKRSVNELADAVWGAFQISVMKRMESEVPLSYLLSGGLDSSALVAMAAEKSKAPLHSFSMSFEEKSFDESEAAALVAKHLGCEHRRIHCGAESLTRVLDHIEQHMSEPLTDGGYVAMWMLCEQVANAGFKVALSGDGADEHFGGYPTYFAHGLVRATRPAGGILSRLADGLPISTGNLSKSYQARRFLAGTHLNLPQRNQVWLGAFYPQEIQSILRDPGDPWGPTTQWEAHALSAPHTGQQAMFLDQRLYLAEGVLQKVDRASMAHGLEIRAPFLDHQLVDLASRLPQKALWRGRQSKVLLRKMLANKVPSAILKRPKKGFGTPIGAWLKGPSAHLLNDLAERLEGLLHPEPIRTLVREHQQGTRDHRRRLWTLLVLSRWVQGPWGPT